MWIVIKKYIIKFFFPKGVKKPKTARGKISQKSHEKKKFYLFFLYKIVDKNFSGISKFYVKLNDLI